MRKEYFVSNAGLIANGATHGNQMKWVEDGDIFCKSDCVGYEGLAEKFVSQFLEVSGFAGEYVKYETVNFFDKQTRLFRGRGCISKNYNSKCLIEVTLQDLIKSYDVKFLERVVLANGYERYKLFYQAFPTYIMEHLLLLTVLDLLVLNDDRHFMNVCFLFDASIPDLIPVPIFDNGAALYSDETMYSFKKTNFENREQWVSALWWTNYEETLAMLQEIGVKSVCINEQAVRNWLNKFNDSKYSSKEVQRCKEVLLCQLQETKGILWQAI